MVMKLKDRTDDSKAIFTIRVPPLVNEKLEERAEKIGISKSAVILNLLYNEFIEGKEQRQRHADYSA